MTDSMPSAFEPHTLGEVSATVKSTLQREVDVRVSLSGSVDAEWRAEFQAIVNALSSNLSFEQAGIGISGDVASIHYTVAADYFDLSVQEIRNIVDRTNEAYVYKVLPARKEARDRELSEAGERARLEAELADKVKKVNDLNS